jgi:hypothetical protein
MTRPPIWLLIATVGMAGVLLVMSVTETSFKGQYLIDQGEYLSLVGLAFILAAGLYLHRQGRLFASLPLVFPWLIYPVITQGDQLIDNLSINWMRLVVHVLLALIFATPVAVLVLAVRQAAVGRAWARSGWASLVPGLRPLADGRLREGTALLMASLLVLEMWIANVFLGTLMIVTLIVLVIGVLIWGTRGTEGAGRDQPVDVARRARLALVTLFVGVVASGALYVGFKNRPGAYQGSPSFYMDPTQAGQAFDLERTRVPAGAPSMPASADLVREALTDYGHSLEKLLAGYYILDRNYNYNFHNELFLRSTPLLANYRQAGLGVIAEARALRDRADVAAQDARATLAGDDPVAALLDDVRNYVAYSFDRAATLERLSGEFERTQAGLQHATHIYEGEGKFLGVRLTELLAKHRGVLEAPALMPFTGDFVRTSRAVHDKYADRIVGF